MHQLPGGDRVREQVRDPVAHPGCTGDRVGVELGIAQVNVEEGDAVGEGLARAHARRQPGQRREQLLQRGLALVPLPGERVDNALPAADRNGQ